jgi:hypothetical protein
LGKDEVEQVVLLEKGTAGWDKVMEDAKLNWLVY